MYSTWVWDMTAAAQPVPDDVLAPVDFLAMEFPGGQLTAPGFERLLSLSDQGVVDILDMEFITKDTDGKSKKSCGGQFRARPGSAPSAAAMGRTGPRERGSGACTATAAVRGPGRCRPAPCPAASGSAGASASAGPGGQHG